MATLQENQAAALAAARSTQRTAAMNAGQGDQTRAVAAALKQYVNAEPWVYFDAVILSATTNFATLVSPLAFFTTRTTGTSQMFTTNMTDTGKMDADFLATSISVDAVCDTDSPSAAQVATAAAFTEAVVNYGVFQILFGQDVKYVAPNIRFPSGGGVVQNAKIRTLLAAGLQTDSAAANNGLQTAQAIKILNEPILFKRGVAFTANMVFPPSPLARLQALQALTGNYSAIIRVSFDGVRGKPMLQGTPVRAATQR